MLGDKEDENGGACADTKKGDEGHRLRFSLFGY